MRVIITLPQHFAKNQHFEEILYETSAVVAVSPSSVTILVLSTGCMSYTSPCFSIDEFIVVSVGDRDFPNPIVLTSFNFLYLTKLIRTF